MTSGVDSEKQEPKLTPEQLREKIIYQVEFYFGDYNLPKDKFLRKKAEENEGWLEIDTLLTFNRLKNLTTDKAVIANALKTSDHGIVEVSDDNLKIRRNPAKPLPESFKVEFMDRTVYVKGFPKDTTLDQLIDFFRPYGSGCVKMRRFSFNRQFKGSVFVLMESEEAAKKLREAEGLKYQDEELILMMAQEHAEEKAKRKDSTRKRKSENGEGDANDNDDLKEMARIDEMFQKMDKKPGVFLRLSGIPKQSDITFQDIKSVFMEAGNKVAFVEFEKGQEEAMIRFEEENGAKSAAEKLIKEGKLMIKDSSLEARVLEGEDETAQYRKQAAHKANRFQNDRTNRKRAGQHRQQGYRGRGVKRGNGGRGRDERKRQTDSEPDAKKPKGTEAKEDTGNNGNATVVSTKTTSSSAADSSASAPAEVGSASTGGSQSTTPASAAAPAAAATVAE